MTAGALPQITRSPILGLALAIAACPARQQSPQPSPAADSPRGRHSAVEPYPIDLIVSPPIALVNFEHADIVDPPAARPLLGESPLKPLVLLPPRPSVRGDALELADLALKRGDALDAAAQYRAFVDSRDDTVARYAQFQLARALAMRGDRLEGQRIFLQLARGADPIAWPALVELARLRADEIGPRATLLEVRVVARGRFEALADYLIHTSPAEVGPLLLADKSARTQRCTYAYRAIELDPAVSLDTVPRDCRAVIEEPRNEVLWRDHNSRWRAFEGRIDEVIERWDALARETRQGHGDPEAWLTLADDVYAIAVPTGRAAESYITTSTASAAVTVAVELSLARIPHDRVLVQRLLVATRRFGGAAGDRMRARIAAALAAGP